MRLNLAWAGRIIGLAALLLASQPRAQAQTVADTASYTLSKLNLANLGGALLPKTNQMLLVEAQHPHRDSTLVRQWWFDERLRLRRRAVLPLRGKNLRPTSVQAAGTHALLYLTGRDSLYLVVVDTAGRPVARAREALPRPRKQHTLLALDVPSLNGFLLVQQRLEGACLLTCRNPDLTVRWQKTLGPEERLVSVAADSTHLWAIAVHNGISRHPTSTALCLDLATGAELSQTFLSAPQNRRLPAIAGMGPGHALLVAGYAYRGQGMNRHHSGDLFVQQLSPTGQVLADQQVPLRPVLKNLQAHARKVAWQLVQPAAPGGVQVVGETYTTSSAASCTLRTIFSAGLLGFDVLRPREVVSLRVSASGQPEQLLAVPLPTDRGAFVWPFYHPPVLLAQLATESFAFRSRGILPDSATLVLRSPQRVQTFDLRTGGLTLLRTAPAQGQTEVLHVGPTFVLLGEARLPGTLRLLRVGLPAGK